MDQSKAIVQQTHFDPWGNRMEYSSWNTSQAQISFSFHRGFTGHEHYDRFKVVNANARLYDPVIGRFFSPDPFVQAPDFTQNFNRYSYCMNNPVMYSDPDGLFLTWGFNHQGFSFGINLTPLGIPLGFGINVSWANGGSVGVYGEVAYRVGGTGLGYGIGVQQSLDYSFNYGLNTTTTISAYCSFGYVTVGGSASYYYNYSYAQGNLGWNIGIGVAWNPNMPYSAYGQSMGIGLGISYGSGGFNYGFNGYYQGLSLQNKLDILTKRYLAELTDAIGTADPQVLVGSNSNFRKNGVAAHNCYGDIWDETSNRRVNGMTIQGHPMGLVEIDGLYYASIDSDIYISKNSIRQLWKGSEYGKRTLFHEWVHACDFYSGRAAYWISQSYNLIQIMEQHAYNFVNSYFPNLPPTYYMP